MRLKRLAGALGVEIWQFWQRYNACAGINNWLKKKWYSFRESAARVDSHTM
jgi:hypothetical protein